MVKTKYDWSGTQDAKLWAKVVNKDTPDKKKSAKALFGKKK